MLEFGTKSGEYPYGVQDMRVNSRSQMTFLVQSLLPNTTYYFRVRGGNGCATGPWSNEISASTKSLVSFNQLNMTSELVPEEEIGTSEAKSCQTYTVKSGDNLWILAQDLLGDGAKYKDIIDQNKDTYPSLETSNNLSTGWKLKVNCSGTSSTGGAKEETKTTEEGYDVNVKVVDTKQKPVEGAEVTLHSTPRKATTDAKGIASFTNVEAGDHRVLIAYDGYEGEQSLNLSGDVKSFSLNVTIERKNVLVAPQVLAIIGVLFLVIISLAFWVFRLRKNK